MLKSVHFKETNPNFISFKSIVIFVDFVLISAKMTTLMKEMRIAQLSSYNEQTLVHSRGHPLKVAFFRQYNSFFKSPTLKKSIPKNYPEF